MRDKAGNSPMAAYRLPIVVLAFCLGLSAAGASAETGDFLGVPITPAAGRFVVTTDVNVRAEPKTQSRKVATLSRADTVESAGRAKADDGWIAVLKDGKPLGFVYGDVLLPLIDGALTDTVDGEVSSSDSGTCAFSIHFDGKSPVEDGLFEVADYTVKFNCTGAEKALAFSTPMFLTEAPYRMGAKPEYQITLDIVEIQDANDQVFSSTSIYDTAKETVRFDGVTITDFGDGAQKKGRPVADVPEALKTAVSLAVQAWNEKLWTALAKIQD